MKRKVYKFLNLFQIGKLEDTRNRTLNGILRVQSCFRGHKARQYIKELKRGIFSLQACTRLLIFFLSFYARSLMINVKYGDLRYSSTVARGETTRKEFAILLQRHRAAVIIQKKIKAKISRKRFEDILGASIMLQAGNIFVYADLDFLVR